MKIKKFKLAFDYDQIANYLSLCTDILTSDRPISNGTYVKNFENMFSKIVRSKYAIAVGSGTDALEAALMSLEITNKIVLVPTNTMFGTYISIIRSGNNPILVDIEDDGFSIDPYLVEELISSDPDKIGAVITVHIGGTASPKLNMLSNICNTYSVPLIEDAAQAVCAHRVGIYGDLTCYSFSATKPMTTGEGGMITTNKEHLANILRSIRNFGTIDNAHVHNIMSGNMKMTEFQAALGITELDRVKDRIARRKEINKIYADELMDNEYLHPVDMRDGSYYKQIVLCDKLADNIENECNKRDVSMTGRVYQMPLHMQPCIKKSITANNSFRIADQYSSHHICPPNYPELTDEEVKYVCDILKEVTSYVE